MPFRTHSPVEASSRQFNRSSPFARLWVGKSASSLSDFLVASSLPILAALLTESRVLVAAVTTALTLPWLIFGLTAGVLVDRFDRRAAMLVAAVVRGAVYATAGLLAIAGWLPDLGLLVIAIATGASQVITETATISLTPRLVDRKHLERANSRLLTAELVVESGAALVAGTLASVGAGLVCGAGATSAAIAFIVLRRLQVPADSTALEHEPRTQSTGLLDGIRLLWSIPVLRSISLMGAVINTAWTAFTATFVLYAITPGPVGLSARRYSLLVTASIAGGIFGAALAPRILKRVGNRWGIGLNILANAVTFGVPVLTASPWIIGIAFFLGDSASPQLRVAVNTLQQRNVPEELRGRVVAAYRMISLGAAVAGPPIGVAIAEVFGSRGLFAAASITCLLMFVPWYRTVTAQSLKETRH
ncbi:MAG: MFS transporter [Thermomicrobiales bacterium]